jgi:hypothetical protein
MLKKVVSLLITSILLVIGLSLVACGGNENGTATTTKPPSTTPVNTNLTTTTATTPTNTTAAQTTVPSSGLSWDDIPIYGGAGQIKKGSWSIPPADDSEYSKFEWRYYEASAGVDTVSVYYRSQMPAKGWTEKGWTEIEGMRWGMYDRNNENDAAMIWVNNQDGKTVIAVWRATK